MSKLPSLENFLKDPNTRYMTYKEREDRGLVSNPIAIRKNEDKTYDICLLSVIKDDTKNSTVPTSFLKLSKSEKVNRLWVAQCEPFEGYEPTPEEVTEVNTISKTDLERIQVKKYILKSTKEEPGWSDFIVVNKQGEPVRRTSGKKTTKKTKFDLPF